MFRIEDVRPAAEGLVAEMRPVCRQIAIAGSVRRGKAEVGDLEIVAEPILTQEADIFGNLSGRPLAIGLAEVLCRLVRTGEVRMGDKWGPRYKKLWVPIDGLPCIQLDLFVVMAPAQFGPQMVIRTGPASFSKRFVTKRAWGGLMPSYLQEKDGCIWNGDKALETPTEESVFEALGLKWVEPGERR